MDEMKYLNDFSIISFAGDSKSKSMLAIKAAREGDFDKAEAYMKAAEEGMNLAHEKQFEMLQQESNGNPVDLTIVTVHGQDHLTMAIMMYDLAKEFMYLYKEIRK